MIIGICGGSGSGKTTFLRDDSVIKIPSIESYIQYDRSNKELRITFTNNQKDIYLLSIILYIYDSKVIVCIVLKSHFFWSK